MNVYIHIRIYVCIYTFHHWNAITGLKSLLQVMKVSFMSDMSHDTDSWNIHIFIWPKLLQYIFICIYICISWVHVGHCIRIHTNIYIYIYIMHFMSPCRILHTYKYKNKENFVLHQFLRVIFVYIYINPVFARWISVYAQKSRDYTQKSSVYAQKSPYIHPVFARWISVYAQKSRDYTQKSSVYAQKSPRKIQQLILWYKVLHILKGDK